MSHSTTVTDVTYQVYYDSVNGAMKALGLGPIPAGATTPHITQEALAKMVTAVTDQWKGLIPTSFGGLPENQKDSGYFGPLSHVQQGVAPPNVVSQIKQDFTEWGLPLTDPGLFNEIAEEITTKIVTSGHGWFAGQKQITDEETLWWVVGAGQADITTTEKGVLYVFAANAAIEI